MPEAPPVIKYAGLILICLDPIVPIVAIKKNRPPNHCELDLHNKSGSLILLTFSIIEKPVVVIPDTDSKYEFNKLIS